MYCPGNSIKKRNIVFYYSRRPNHDLSYHVFFIPIIDVIKYAPNKNACEYSFIKKL